VQTDAWSHVGGDRRHHQRIIDEETKTMRHLGILRGAGTLESRGEVMGRAGYEFDGYLVRPGEVVASGEIRMAADALSKAFGRRDVSLRTDDGRVLAIRLSGRRQGAPNDAAHVDVLGGLPPEKEWRR
jgi:hypothetical protein